MALLQICHLLEKGRKKHLTNMNFWTVLARKQVSKAIRDIAESSFTASLWLNKCNFCKTSVNGSDSCKIFSCACRSCCSRTSSYGNLSIITKHLNYYCWKSSAEIIYWSVHIKLISTENNQLQRDTALRVTSLGLTMNYLIKGVLQWFSASLPWRWPTCERLKMEWSKWRSRGQNVLTFSP